MKALKQEDDTREHLGDHRLIKVTRNYYKCTRCKIVVTRFMFEHLGCKPVTPFVTFAEHINYRKHPFISDIHFGSQTKEES